MERRGRADAWKISDPESLSDEEEIRCTSDDQDFLDHSNNVRSCKVGYLRNTEIARATGSDRCCSAKTIPPFKIAILRTVKHCPGCGKFAGKLRRRRPALHGKKLLQEAVVPTYKDFIVATRHCQKAGFAMITPSSVGVPALTLSIRALSRSPAAPIQETAGVLSSLGVVPAVPPP